MSEPSTLCSFAGCPRLGSMPCSICLMHWSSLTPVQQQTLRAAQDDRDAEIITPERLAEVRAEVIGEGRMQQ